VQKFLVGELNCGFTKYTPRSKTENKIPKIIFLYSEVIVKNSKSSPFLFC
jgi:hypothetical protein